MELHGKSLFVAETEKWKYDLQILKEKDFEERKMDRGSFIETENGVNYYEYIRKEKVEGTDKLYCTCGYEGMPEEAGEKYFWGSSEIPLSVYPLNPLSRRYSYRDENHKEYHLFVWDRIKVHLLFACPFCEKEVDVYVSHQSIGTEEEVLIDYYIEREGAQTKRAFKWEVLVYGFDREKKCSVKKRKNVIEVDMTTGETLIRSQPNPRGEEDNITFKMESFSSMKEEIRTIGQSDEAWKLLKEFFEDCLRKRGVHYKSFHEIVCGGSLDADWQRVMHRLDQLQRVMPYLRFPQLETVKWNDWTAMPIVFQEKLEQSLHSNISVIETLTGHRSKRVRGMLEREENLELAIVLGHLIQDPNHLIKLFIPKDHPDEVNIGSIFDLYRNNQKDIRFIRNLYKEEKHFVQGILKLNQCVIQEENEHLPYEFWQYINDISHMNRQIKELDECYEMSFQGDLKKLHDDLARYYRRLKHENKVIPYKKGVLSLYEKVVEGYTFSLAKDTHELLAAGEEMEHCVGSYRQKVLSGESLIVFALNEEGKRNICIEVKQGKKLSQVKKGRNQLPDEKEAWIVKKWADWCGIDAENTPDLKSLKRKIH